MNYFLMASTKLAIAIGAGASIIAFMNDAIAMALWFGLFACFNQGLLIEMHLKATKD